MSQIEDMAAILAAAVERSRNERRRSVYVICRGWAHFVSKHTGITHVIPDKDMREHVPGTTCWCQPTTRPDHLKTYFHRSADGREDYENKLRRPS